MMYMCRYWARAHKQSVMIDGDANAISSLDERYLFSEMLQLLSSQWAATFLQFASVSRDVCTCETVEQHFRVSAS